MFLNMYVLAVSDWVEIRGRENHSFRIGTGKKKKKKKSKSFLFYGVSFLINNKNGQKIRNSSPYNIYRDSVT